MSTRIVQNGADIGSNRSQVRQTPRDVTRILIAGSGHRAVAVARRLSRETRQAVIFGIVDPEPQSEMADAFPELPWLGSFDVTLERLVTHCADELHVALPLKRFGREIAELKAAADEAGVKAVLHLDMGDVHDCETVVSRDGLVVASQVHASLRGVGWLVKRTVDVLVAGTAILLLSPLLAVIALAIAATSRGPVLFRQERVGLGQRVFRMLKFRSMVQNAEELRAAVAERNNARGISFKVFDDPRVTRVGGFLRRSSLDELPQLWNVIRGDMTLVGPRPIPVWVADQLQDIKSYRRFSVQPGLTGLWQVEGRQQDFDWMAMQDLRYIDCWSLRLDLRILLATIPAMVRGEGAH